MRDAVNSHSTSLKSAADFPRLLPVATSQGLPERAAILVNGWPASVLVWTVPQWDALPQRQRPLDAFFVADRYVAVRMD